MADDISFSAMLDTGNFDAGMTVITGALLQVGSLAVDAFANAAAAAIGFFGDAFSGAMEAETNMARFDAVLNATARSAEEQAAAFATASAQNVTYTALSADAVEDLQDKYSVAAEKLGTMEEAFAKLEAPTAAQTVALKHQRETVGELEAQISGGLIPITTNLADQMGLVPPVARLTRDELLGLADQYKNLVGGSDDAVIAAEAVLLKFTQIGKETFPDALLASADLAAFMGTDMASASQMLGLALDDPTNSLARLNKVTGAFTDAEAEAIKAMALAGDVAGAQDLIIQNLNGTIGGTAEAIANTTAGQWAIFQETIADTGEGIMSKLLPPLVQFGQEVLPKILPVIESFGTVLGGLVTSIIPVATALGGMITTIVSGGSVGAIFDNIAVAVSRAFGPEAGLAVMQFGDFIQGIFDWVTANMPLMQTTFTTVWGSIQSVLKGVGDFINLTLMPAITSIWGQSGVELPTMQQIFEGVMAGIVVAAQLVAGYFTEFLIPAYTGVVNWVVANWPAIQAKIEEVWAIVQPILQQTVDFFVNTLIPKFQEAVNWVIENWPQIQAKIEEGWEIVEPILNDTVAFFTETLIPKFQEVVTWVQENWPEIQANIEATMTGIQNVINAVLAAVVPFFLEQFGEIKAWVDENWPLIEATVKQVIENISTNIHSVIDPLVAFWNDNHETIKAIAETMWENMKISIGNAIDIIEGIIKTTMQIITGDWSGAWETIKETVNTVWENMKEVATNNSELMRKIIADKVEELKTWWDGKWKEIQDSVTTIIAATVVAIQTKVEEIKTAFTSVDWLGIGSGIIDSVKSGIGNAVGGLLDSARNAATDAYNAIMTALKGGSPMQVLVDAGKNMMGSMSLGVEAAVSDAVATLHNAAIEIGNAFIEINSVMGQAAGQAFVDPYILEMQQIQAARDILSANMAAEALIDPYIAEMQAIQAAREAAPSQDIIDALIGTFNQNAIPSASDIAALIGTFNQNTAPPSGTGGYGLVAPPQHGGPMPPVSGNVTHTDARQFNLNATTGRPMQTVQAEFTTMQVLAGLT